MPGPPQDGTTWYRGLGGVYVSADNPQDPPLANLNGYVGLGDDDDATWATVYNSTNTITAQWRDTIYSRFPAWTGPTSGCTGIRLWMRFATDQDDYLTGMNPGSRYALAALYVGTPPNPPLSALFGGTAPDGDSTLVALPGDDTTIHEVTTNLPPSSDYDSLLNSFSTGEWGVAIARARPAFGTTPLRAGITVYEVAVGIAVQQSTYTPPLTVFPRDDYAEVYPPPTSYQASGDVFGGYW